VCLIKHPHFEDVLGIGGIAPRILNFGTRWRWIFSSKPPSLYHRKESLVPTR